MLKKMFWRLFFVTCSIICFTGSCFAEEAQIYTPLSDNYQSPVLRPEQISIGGVTVWDSPERVASVLGLPDTEDEQELQFGYRIDYMKVWTYTELRISVIFLNDSISAVIAEDDCKLCTADDIRCGSTRDAVISRYGEVPFSEDNNGKETYYMYRAVDGDKTSSIRFFFVDNIVKKIIIVK